MRGAAQGVRRLGRLGADAHVVATALNAVIHFVPNHFLFQQPTQLPWTRVDAAVPFVPATLWIYFSDYFLVGSAFMLSRTWGEVKAFARAYFALLVTGATVHLFWPTTFPREAFPIVDSGFTAQAFALLRHVDLPTSCLPSMHVAGSYLAAFSLWRRPRGYILAWTAWATAVAISTMTAKQHYAVDVAAGMAMAGAFWALFFWLPGALAARSGAAAAARQVAGPGGAGAARSNGQAAA